MKTSNFRIQVYDSIMCGYFCIWFIDFMLTGKFLTDFTIHFSPHNFKKKWWYNSKIFYNKCLKMAVSNSHEAHNV